MCNPEIANGGSAPIPADSSPTAEITSTTINIRKKGRMVPQVTACMAASLGSLASGAANGWTASALPSIQQDIYMGTTETAFIVGILGVGGILGSLIARRAMDSMGRRKSMVLANPVMIVSWILIAVASNFYLMLFGRLISGVISSILFSAVSVYCSEIPEARVRGTLGSMSSLFISLGVLLSYISGAFLPWRYSCYVCALPALLSMITMLAMPESPYWFMLKDRRDDAETALRWLRGPQYDINEDLESVAAKLKAAGTKSEYRQLLRPGTLRPFLIAMFVMTLQQGSGAAILMIYTSNIFLSIGIEDHYMPTVYTGLVQVVGTITSVLVMDRVGRRTLMVVSVTTVGMFTILLGVYYYLGTLGVSWPQAVALVAMLMSVFGYSFGCRTIPWLTSSELFNTTIRSTANTVCILYNRTLNFVIIQIYPFVAEAAGPHIVFFFFGALSLVLAILAFFILPETRGKSLEQIQDYFEEKSMKKSQRNGETFTASDKKTSVGEKTISHKVDAPYVSGMPADGKLTVYTERGEMTRF